MRLRALLGVNEIVVGDLILCEVLQGLDNERAAREVEALLRRLIVGPLIRHKRCAFGLPECSPGRSRQELCKDAERRSSFGEPSVERVHRGTMFRRHGHMKRITSA